MALTGIAPPDFSTPVGQFRLLANDATPTDVASGTGTYALFSDAEIIGFLAVSPTSLLRGVGYGYLSLAASAALEAKNVKDYDLSADLTKRSGELRSTARAFFDRADVEADLLGTDSTFGINVPGCPPGGSIGTTIIDNGDGTYSVSSDAYIEPTERDVFGWGQF